MTSTRISLDNESVGLHLRGRPPFGLHSLVDRAADRSLLATGAAPLFTLILRNAAGHEIRCSSADAVPAAPEIERTAAGTTAVLRFERVGGLDLEVRCTVSLKAGSPLASFGATIANRTPYGVRAFTYPVVIAPARLDAGTTGTRLLQPWERLHRDPIVSSLPGRDQDDWMSPSQYPGPCTAQFVALYDEEGGIYLAAYDGSGLVKDIGGFRHGDDLDLSIVHHPDERPGIDLELPYPTVLGVFHGDWYDAAEIYRGWAVNQPWCSRTLAERDDVPEWVTRPIPELMTISQGGQERIHGLQTTPGEYPIGRFWPARKAVRLQLEYERILGTKILSWMEGWEKIGAPGGPVEIFPPREGEESYRAAMDELVANGHVPIMYLAGLHWCYKRPQVGYDDHPRFEREGRPLAAVHKDGSLMKCDNHTHLYAMGQKHFYELCVGSPAVNELYYGNFMKMMDVGAVGIQLDQQAGMMSRACYATDHDHPPGYGPWMTERMREFIRRMRAAGKARNALSIFRGELTCEVWIQEMDGFLDRPYHYEANAEIVPLFLYLYHPYIACFSADGILNILHPAASLMLHAKIFSLGLRNTVAYGEEEYNLEVNPDYPALRLLRNIFAAQRTFARDYVVFGRMLRPAAVECGRVTADGFRGEPWETEIPQVFCASWEAPDGRVGHVMANWTEEPREAVITVQDATEGGRFVTSEGSRELSPKDFGSGRVTVTVPPLDAAVLEQYARREARE